MSEQAGAGVAERTGKEERMSIEVIQRAGGGNRKMDKVTKATLTLLIAEILACQDMAEVKRVLDSWIKANDLHPEEVGTFDAESGWIKQPRESGNTMREDSQSGLD